MDELDVDRSDRHNVATVVSDDLVVSQARHLGDESGLVPLGVDRHRDQLQQLLCSADLEAHHGAAHVVRVVVGGQHAGAPHAVRLQDIHQATHVVRRVHDDRLTGLAITDEVCSGSVGLKIGMIAERRADLYVHVSDKSCRWDACGPEAVIRAAGGRFTDLDGAAFVYAGQDVANRRGIVACNGVCFDEVLPAVRAAGQAAGLIN